MRIQAQRIASRESRIISSWIEGPSLFVLGVPEYGVQGQGRGSYRTCLVWQCC